MCIGVCPTQALYWRYISKVRPEDLYRHEELPDMVRARECPLAAETRLR